MLEVGPVSYTDLDAQEKPGESSDSIRARVLRARSRQQERFAKKENLETNSDMRAKDVAELINLTTDARTILHESASRLKLSARAYHRVQKLARTIADLGDSDHVETVHILEALSYRPKSIQ
jgi:magnesium chelatase family protein